MWLRIHSETKSRCDDGCACTVSPDQNTRESRGTQNMLTVRMALTSLTEKVGLSDLASAAAALQTQVTRDFAPLWGIHAVVSAAEFGAIPYGVVPVIVQDRPEWDGQDGMHRTRDHDSPYIVVPYGPVWSLAASHMILRMLADPSACGRAPGPSPLPGQGTVEYLTDICGPCQDVDAAYQIDGIVVSDFCLPGFYGSDRARAGIPFSFTGALTGAFRPAPGGAVTWLADDGLLYQLRVGHGGAPSVQGGFCLMHRGRMLLREAADLLTPARFARLANAPLTQQMANAEDDARRARMGHMLRLRDELARRCAPPPDRQTAEPVRRGVRARGGYRMSSQQRASAEVATTERTAF